jgi:hypothetical protein
MSVRINQGKNINLKKEGENMKTKNKVAAKKLTYKLMALCKQLGYYTCRSAMGTGTKDHYTKMIRVYNKRVNAVMIGQHNILNRS